MVTPARPLLVASLVSVALFVSAALATAGEPPDPDAAGLTPAERRSALVARSAWEHARLETLEAAFVQRQEGVMLLEPEVSRGRFAYRGPDSMRWDYRLGEPEPVAGVPESGGERRASAPVTVIIHGQAMTTWHRESGRVERVDVGRRAEKLLRLLGPGASLADLERYFALEVEIPEAAGEPYGVRLEPRTARVARRIRAIRMEIDRRLFLPTFLRLTDPDGGVTELRFDQLQINGDLPADHFQPDLPGN